jgi:hypothetical protein
LGGDGGWVSCFKMMEKGEEKSEKGVIEKRQEI